MGWKRSLYALLEAINCVNSIFDDWPASRQSDQFRCRSLALSTPQIPLTTASNTALISLRMDARDATGFFNAREGVTTASLAYWLLVNQFGRAIAFQRQHVHIGFAKVQTEYIFQNRCQHVGAKFVQQWLQNLQ